MVKDDVKIRIMLVSSCPLSSLSLDVCCDGHEHDADRHQWNKGDSQVEVFRPILSYPLCPEGVFFVLPTLPLRIKYAPSVGLDTLTMREDERGKLRKEF